MGAVFEFVWRVRIQVLKSVASEVLVLFYFFFLGGQWWIRVKACGKENKNAGEIEQTRTDVEEGRRKRKFCVCAVNDG